MSAKDIGAPGGEDGRGRDGRERKPLTGRPGEARVPAHARARQSGGGHARGGDADNQSGLFGKHIAFDPHAPAKPFGRGGYIPTLEQRPLQLNRTLFMSFSSQILFRRTGLHRGGKWPLAYIVWAPPDSQIRPGGPSAPTSETQIHSI